MSSYAQESGLSGLPSTAIWTSVPNVLGSPDGVGAEILSFTPLDAGGSTSILGVWDFGISVPCNATIDMVSFNVVRRNNAASGDVRDETAFVRFEDFSISSVNGADMSASFINSTSTFETATISPAGGWGSVLTPDIINNPLFGILLTYENLGTATGFPEIDAVEMEVCYTVNGAPQSPIEASILEQVDNLCGPSASGSLTINASGSTGNFEYSIDGGATWVTNNVFTALPTGTYQVLVRDSDLSCVSDLGPYFVGCNPGQILQVGDAIYTCLPTTNDPVTLAIDRVQELNTFFNNGMIDVDVSPLLQSEAFTWTTSDLGGSVFGVALDDDFNIYTGLSSLYNLITPVSSPDFIRIDGVTGTPAILATLPGTAGIGQLEYHSACDQVFLTNLDDGMIYRFDTNGNLLSSFDPLGADNGIDGLAPLGERLVALSFNTAEDRLYYSVWANDAINNGMRNTIRSVAIDPVSCDFVPATDNQEFVMPFISETENSNNDFSMPVIDIEFSLSGNMLLISESGFNSTVPITQPHAGRVLRIDGMSTAWSLVNNPPAGNMDYQYQIGTVNDGTNALGGVDFAYAGMDAGGCVSDEEAFILATGDALRGVDCTVGGCVYGLQYIPIEGGRPETSVLVDLARAPDSQQKGFFGDVDVVTGCCPCACPALDFTIDATDVNLCDGEMSTLCVTTPVGAMPPFTYLWDDGSTTACITVSPTMTTTYMVDIMDSNMCMYSESITISLSPPLSINGLNEVNNTGCMTFLGAITIDALGGTAPLTFSIDGGATSSTTNSFTNLDAGTYNIVVTDAFGCTVTSSTTLSGPPPITISTASTVDTECNSDNGTITITASGGTAPLMYSIDGGTTFSASAVFSNVMEGTYNIVVSDAGSCMVTDMVTVVGPGMISVSAVATQDTECAMNNGTITITEMGGTPPIMYSIDNGVTFSANPVFSNVMDGTYDIVVSDAGGCTATTTATVAGPDAVSISFMTTQDTECETDNGSISITATGGTPPYMYSIDGGITFGTNPLITNLSDGVYNIVVSDAGNCSDSGVATIAGPDPILATESAFDDTDCELDNGRIVITASGGTPPFTYSIDGITFDASNEFTGLAPGQYDVVIRDSQNCTESINNINIGEPDCNITGAVGDFVFEDLNGDGTQDPGEPGIPDVRVELFNSNNVLIGIEITDSNGNFLFDDVPGGDFYIRFVRLDDEFTATFPNASGNTNTDSDVDDSNGPFTTPIFTLGDGEIDLSRDLGVFRCIPIGENIWFDFNEDGIRDNSENGINGVQVELFRMVAGFWIKTDVTISGHEPGTGSEDGFYKFCAPPGTYYLQFLTSANRIVTTVANRGGDETRDSDLTNRFGPGTTDEFTVRSGDTRCDIGAGYVPAGSIGDFVWFDSNTNGLRDSDEEGMSGVRIEAINSEGNLLALSNSDDNGKYILDLLPEDEYYVRFVLPEGFISTAPNVGTDEARDSDVDDSNGLNTTALMLVRPGEHVNVDAGFVSSALPVTWLGITGEKEDDYNLIKWSVAQERNVSHYELQKAQEDPLEFRTIGSVESEYGTFSGILDYALEDFSIEAGLNYYRVKQFDFDGKFSFSDVVSINNDTASEEKKFKLNVYPNPVQEELNIALEVFGNTQEVEIRMYNQLGQLMSSGQIFDFNVESGLKTYPIDVTSFVTGIYTLEINVDNKQEIRKIAITKM